MSHTPNHLLTPKKRRRLLKNGPERAIAEATRNLWAGNITIAQFQLAAICEEYPTNAHALFFASLATYQGISSMTDPAMKQRCAALAEEFMRACIQRADPKDPNVADAHYNLGKYLIDRGAMDEALEQLLRAIERRPQFPVALNNLGGCFLHFGDLDSAEACYQRSMAMSTSDPCAKFNGAFIKLLRGDLVGGFRDYEERWNCPSHTVEYRKHIHTRIKRWTGQPLHGGPLLIWHEQGSGDTIHLMRYIPHLRGTLGVDGPIYLDVPANLKRLMERYVPQDVRVIPRDVEPIPYCAAHASIVSLPGLFGGVIPETPTPYVHATPNLPPNPYGLPRVGLSWAGSRSHRADRFRSIAFEELRAFGELPGVEMVSLQIGDREEEATDAPWLGKVGHGGDFLDTAERIASCDVVVSVDTSIVHLAGALNIPCYAMLAAAPDWRWMLKRSDSPWYPSVRLVRQERGGEWRPVVRRVVDLLYQQDYRRAA